MNSPLPLNDCSFTRMTLTLNNTQSFIYTLRKKSNLKKLRGAFNKFPDFFVQAFKIVVDS